MVNQSVEFSESPETEDQLSNLNNMEWIELKNEDNTIMAEANISEVATKKEGIRALLVELEMESVVAAQDFDVVQQSPDSDPLVSRFSERISNIETRIDIIEEILDIEHVEESVRSYYTSEVAARSVEEEYSDDWYANNPDWYLESEDQSEEE